MGNIQGVTGQFLKTFRSCRRSRAGGGNLRLGTCDRQRLVHIEIGVDTSFLGPSQECHL